MIFGGGVRDMKPSDAKVYLVLAAHTNKDGLASVGQRRIAKLAGIYGSTCNTAMKRLEDAGHIVIEQMGTGTRPSTIRLSVRAQPNTSPAPSVRPHTNANGEAEKAQRSDSDALAFGLEAPSVRVHTNETEEQRNREGPRPSPQGGEGGELRQTIIDLFFADGVAGRQQARLNAAVRDLGELGATPDQIRQRSHRAGEQWDKPFSPEALVKHWATLGRNGQAAAPREPKLGRALQ